MLTRFAIGFASCFATFSASPPAAALGWPCASARLLQQSATRSARDSRSILAISRAPRIGCARIGIAVDHELSDIRMDAGSNIALLGIVCHRLGLAPGGDGLLYIEEHAAATQYLFERRTPDHIECFRIQCSEPQRDSGLPQLLL